MPKQLLLSDFRRCPENWCSAEYSGKGRMGHLFCGRRQLLFSSKRGDAKQAFRAGEPDGKWTRAGVRSGGFTFAHSTAP